MRNHHIPHHPALQPSSQPSPAQALQPHKPAWHVSHSTEMLPCPSDVSPVPQCQDASSSLHFSRERGSVLLCPVPSLTTKPWDCSSPFCSVVIPQDSRPQAQAVPFSGAEWHPVLFPQTQPCTPSSQWSPVLYRARPGAHEHRLEPPSPCQAASAN